MEGFLLIDKPANITSFRVVAEIRRATGVKRVGHAGTLDPLATGLLILAIGRSATRKLGSLLALDKMYEAEFTFGATSATFDAEGAIEKAAIDPSLKKHFAERLRAALPRFTGELLQTPPIFSAVKVRGKKAYELARQGKTPKLKKRRIIVKELKLLQCRFPKATFLIHCSKGTYVRSLAHDLGKALGAGAYLSKLRRTRIGAFDVANAQTLEEAVRNPFATMAPYVG